MSINVIGDFAFFRLLRVVWVVPDLAGSFCLVSICYGCFDSFPDRSFFTNSDFTECLDLKIY